MAKSARKSAVEMQSTRFKTGAFQGKTQSWQLKDTKITQSISVKFRPGWLVATTEGQG